jgi:hypothetical protein
MRWHTVLGFDFYIIRSTQAIDISGRSIVQISAEMLIMVSSVPPGKYWDSTSNYAISGLFHNSLNILLFQAI